MFTACFAWTDQTGFVSFTAFMVLEKAHLLSLLAVIILNNFWSSGVRSQVEQKKKIEHANVTCILIC